MMLAIRLAGDGVVISIKLSPIAKPIVQMPRRKLTTATTRLYATARSEKKSRSPASRTNRCC